MTLWLRAMCTNSLATMATDNEVDLSLKNDEQSKFIERRFICQKKKKSVLINKAFKRLHIITILHELRLEYILQDFQKKRDIWCSFVFKLEDLITKNRTTNRTSTVDGLYRHFWQKTSLALNCFCLFFSINKAFQLRQAFLKSRIVPSLMVKDWFTILSKLLLILWDHQVLLHSTAFLQHLQK